MDLGEEGASAKEHQTARRGDATETTAQIGASWSRKEGIDRGR